MHKLYMHHGVALLGGRANRSAKLGWQKERARPARSYCQPMMHFIFILQVDLVGNSLLYSISEEMSSNLTRFLNVFDKFFSGLTRIRTHGPFLLPSQLGRAVSTPFRDKSKRYSTALSNYIWTLKDSNTDYTIRWKIVDRGRAYSPSTKICNLCLKEKYVIICKPQMASLNSRNELKTECRHRKKHLLYKL